MTTLNLSRGRKVNTQLRLAKQLREAAEEIEKNNVEHIRSLLILDADMMRSFEWTVDRQSSEDCDFIFAIYAMRGIPQSDKAKKFVFGLKVLNEAVPFHDATSDDRDRWPQVVGAKALPYGNNRIILPCCDIIQLRGIFGEVGSLNITNIEEVIEVIREAREIQGSPRFGWDDKDKWDAALSNFEQKKSTGYCVTYEPRSATESASAGRKFKLRKSYLKTYKNEENDK